MTTTKLNIVLLGKIGTGKSTLFNSLFNQQLARVGETLSSETKLMGGYTKRFTVNGVDVTIWDTPGLKDKDSDSKSTLEMIGGICEQQGVDIFVYCTPFNQPKMYTDDVDCIRDISRAFTGIWDKAIFALTFADKYDTNLSEFEDRLGMWRKMFCKYVEENAGAVQVDSIPFIPTSDDIDLLLPGHRSWLSDFWCACIKRMNMPALSAMTRVANELVDDHAGRARIAKVIQEQVDKLQSPNKVQASQIQGGAIATTPISTPRKSAEESDGTQGEECSPSKKLSFGPLNLDEDEKSKINLLHDGIQKYLQENDRLDDEHELCTESNREFFEKCDLSSYDCMKYKSSSTNAPQRSRAGKASNRQAGDKTTMVTASKKKSRETSKQVTSTTGVGFNKFGVTGKQQVAMAYGTKRGSEEGEAVDTPVDFELDESTDVQTAYEIWPMETEIKDLPIILPKDMPLYYHKIGKKMGHCGPLHIGQEKVDLKGIEEIQISGTYRWEYQCVASIF